MQTDRSQTSPPWNFSHSYAELPGSFYAHATPVNATAPQLVLLNRRLLETLGIAPEHFPLEVAASVFSGNTLPTGANPIAQAYAGHQFGHFTMLGDGRAILLGEHVAPDGKRFDIQLKGAGRTPYSRRGDGLAALGPMLREYIISEAMHALGIPTTRSLAVVLTGEAVMREQPLPGAVLTRVAESHLRVGTFEFAAATGKPELLKALADYTLQRHFPECMESHNPYLAMLQAVMERQASLVSQWMLVGFIHGVMNTDNMAIGGQTIDYGPCAFMDEFSVHTVFSSIDHQGRYAYGNQPKIAQWNLARFAETLLPLLHADREEATRLAEIEILSFPALYQRYWLTGMRAKLGLPNAEEGDTALAESLLTCMQLARADFTNTFAGLSGAQKPVVFDDAIFGDWYERWLERASRQPGGVEAARARMQTVNPVVIPRNHLVEEALLQAESEGNLEATIALIEVLAQPYTLPKEPEHYCTLPEPSKRVYQTFCGT